jgi:hypothetical protein
MKKVLVFLLLVIFLAAVGAVAFVATFDWNRLKPVLEKEAAKAVGRPVRIGSISLTFRGGLAFDIAKIAVFEHETAAVPAAYLDQAKAVLDLKSLLKKQVVLSGIWLERPSLHLIRGADGNWAIAGIQGPGSSGIIPGEIRVTDPSGPRPVDFSLRGLTLHLKELAPGNPLNFKMSSSFFSPEENLRVRGILVPPAEKGQPGVLREGALELDLDALDLDGVSQAFPVIGEWGLANALRGQFKAELHDLKMAPEGLAQARLEASLTGGRLGFSQWDVLLDDLTVAADLENDRLTLRTFSARLGEGSVELAGTVDSLSVLPRAQFEGGVKSIDLAPFIKETGPGSPVFRGILSLSVRGSAKGKTMPDLIQSSQGMGQIVLQNGVILNLNVLRMVFESMSILPGVVEKLQSRLPESYQSKLETNDTVLQDAKLPFTFQGGVVSFEDLRLVSEAFELTGAVRVGFNGRVMGKGMIIIDPELSAAFSASVKELQYLAVEGERLGIPVFIQGSLNQIQVLPDLGYIAKRLAVVKTQEMISGFMRPREGQPAQAPSGPAQTTQQQEPPTLQSLISAFLDSGKQGGGGSSGQTSSQSGSQT